jgi:hypothetical protein
MLSEKRFGLFYELKRSYERAWILKRRGEQ